MALLRRKNRQGGRERAADGHPVDEVLPLDLWRLGARLPIVQGTSFAAVATMLAIARPAAAGRRACAIYGALIVAGLIGLAIAVGRCQGTDDPGAAGAVAAAVGRRPVLAVPERRVGLVQPAWGWRASRVPWTFRSWRW